MTQGTYHALWLIISYLNDISPCRNLAERCPGAQTNNRAELIVSLSCLYTSDCYTELRRNKAILRVLETTLPIATQRLLIKTDSKYSIHC